MGRLPTKTECLLVSRGHGKRSWTAKEDDRLRQEWELRSVGAWQTVTGRSAENIKTRAAELGLPVNPFSVRPVKGPTWTETEEKYLADHWAGLSMVELSRELDRNPPALFNKARKLGLPSRRKLGAPAKPPKPKRMGRPPGTGHPIHKPNPQLRAFLCAECGKIFDAYVSDRVYPNIYCSPSCASKGRERAMGHGSLSTSCAFCAEPIRRPKSQISPNENAFCGRPCYFGWRRAKTQEQPIPAELLAK